MRRPRDASEFLPAALELRDTPPAPAGRVLLWTIVGLLGASLAWAAASEVDIVAVAPGRVVPGGYSKLVQPLEAGTVRVISVRDGDRVRAGQLLVALDDASAAADAHRIADDLGRAERERERLGRLAALAAGEPVGDAPSGDAFDPLLAARWLAHRGKLDSLEAERGRRAADCDTARQEAERIAALLPFLERRARDHEVLAERKLVADQQQRDALQTLTEAREELAVQRRRIASAEHALAAADAVAREARAEFRRVVAEQAEAAERQAAALAQELVKARARLAAHRLTAPVDGTVQQLAVHTIGGVVTPAQVLLVVVPDGAPVEVEALVANKDAGFVAPGQQAQIKLDAFPFTRYGTAPGTVAGLSRDAVPDDRLGLVYKATVQLERDHLLHEGRHLAVGTGMAATVEIRTGSRRVLDFVLSPLRQHLAEAGRER